MEQRNGQPIVVYDTTGKWSGALLHDEKRLPQAILQILYKVWPLRYMHGGEHAEHQDSKDPEETKGRWLVRPEKIKIQQSHAINVSYKHVDD